MKPYDAFKASGKLIEETESVKVYQCSLDEKKYIIIVSKKRANQRTIIHCLDNYVAWQVRYRFPTTGGKAYSDILPIYKFTEDKNHITLFVVKGKPVSIQGLDDGIFCSAKMFHKNSINVMSYKRFKELDA